MGVIEPRLRKVSLRPGLPPLYGVHARRLQMFSGGGGRNVKANVSQTNLLFIAMRRPLHPSRAQHLRRLVAYTASPRNWAESFLKSIGFASRSSEAWTRWSSERDEISANFIRIGVAIASPKAMASRSAIEERDRAAG